MTDTATKEEREQVRKALAKLRGASYNAGHLRTIRNLGPKLLATIEKLERKLVEIREIANSAGHRCACVVLILTALDAGAKS